MRSALLLLGVLAACTYVDPDPDWAGRQARVPVAAAFVRTHDDLRGVDSPTDAERVEKGDRVLYGIEFTKAGAKRNWLVHVEVEDPCSREWPTRSGGRMRTMLLGVRVYDEAGTEVGRDVVAVSREDLVFGLATACQAPDARLGGDGPDQTPGALPMRADLRRRIVADLSLRNMLRVIRESHALFAILYTVIDTPSVFSVIRNLGVRVSLESDFAGARRVESIVVDGRAYATYELPVQLRMNGTPALRAKLLVTDSLSPLNLSAGILAIDAFQPSDPDARVSLRVLAARRAPGR